MIIRNFKEFSEFMSANLYLHDARIQCIEVPDNGVVRIGLNFQASGGYDGGDPIVIREMTLMFKGVCDAESDLPEFDSEHMCEEPEYEELDAGLSITFYLPGPFSFTFTELSVSMKDIETIQKPWISLASVNLHLSDKPPLPETLIGQLEQIYREPLAWRIYGGSAANNDEIPWPDYTGWIIQRRSRLDDTREGIIFHCFNVKTGNASLTMETQDTFLTAGIPAVVSALLKEAATSVMTGNVHLNREEWNALSTRDGLEFAGFRLHFP